MARGAGPGGVDLDPDPTLKKDKSGSSVFGRQEKTASNPRKTTRNRSDFDLINFILNRYKSDILVG